MLNKAICKQCINQHTAPHSRWNKKDEHEFEREAGCIICPGGYLGFINLPARQHCKYRIEQIMSDKSNAE